MPESNTLQGAGLLRRLAAILYDSFLLLAILFVAAIPAVYLNHGEAPHGIAYTLYLYLVIYLFFAWFWTHGGQTLGMRAWKLRLKTIDGKTISWQATVIRFLAATLSVLIAGAGFIWVLFDRNNLTLHDRISKTVVILVKDPG